MENQILPLWNNTPSDAFSPSLTLYPERLSFTKTRDARDLSREAKRSAAPSSAVIIIPGGGYSHKAAHEGEPIARMLNRAGISACVLDYHIAPCAHDAPMRDALRAIRLLRSRGVEKVGILGFSAGGHVCCCAAVHYDLGDPNAEDPVERFSSRPDVFIPCYPVVTFGPHTHVRSMETLLGDSKDDLSLRDFYSCEKHVTPDTPEAFLWHTAEDQSVPPANTLLLAAALSENKVPFELHIYPTGRHGLGLAEGTDPASIWQDACCQFLLRHGFGA